jgi:hypothetical protein
MIKSNNLLSHLNSMQYENFTDKKTQFDYVEARWKTYNEVQINIVTHLGKIRDANSREYIETVRNIALVAGGIATFSVTLLNAFSSPSLLIGESLLLVDVMFCVAHLMGNFSKSAKLYISQKDRFLKPIIKMSDISREFCRGRKDYQEWVTKEKKFLEEDWDRISNDLDDEFAKEDRLQHSDILIMVIFIIAVSLIIYALVSPYLISVMTKLV